MGKKILFVDVDDTLLDDNKNVCQRNKDAIHAMLEQGHKLVINSGRSLASVKIQAGRIDLNVPGCYLICHNGAQIYDIAQDKTLYRHRMDSDVVPGIFTICDRYRERFPKLHCHSYNDEHVVATRIDDGLLKYCKDIICTYQIVNDIAEFAREDPPNKVLVSAYYDHDILVEIQGEVLEKYGDKVDAIFSMEYHLDIGPKGVNKGTGIRKLAEIVGVPIEDTISAGDAMNDEQMIREAGIGCVMSNGDPELKKIADYVTTADNNEGGVAEIIDKFILN